MAGWTTLSWVAGHKQRDQKITKQKEKRREPTWKRLIMTTRRKNYKETQKDYKQTRRTTTERDAK